MQPDILGRDKAGNRTHFFDRYLSLQVLDFFNPTLNNVRVIGEPNTIATGKGLEGAVNLTTRTANELSLLAR